MENKSFVLFEAKDAEMIYPYICPNTREQYTWTFGLASLAPTKDVFIILKQARKEV